MLRMTHRWVAFVLPMTLFMVIGSFEPKPPELANRLANGQATAPWSIPYSFYPWIYTGKLIATLIALYLVWPEYKPLKTTFGWKGIAFGIVGGFLWISICELQLEQSTLRPLLRSWSLESLLGTGIRSAFNPFEELRGNTIGILLYLAIRGIGLVLVVPVMEEYFLRGFAIRFFAAEQWWSYPIGRVTVLSAIVGTVLPMLMHPGELFAAAVWFSMITFLAYHTKSLWECIVAHGVTNFILGVYVIAYGAWQMV